MIDLSYRHMTKELMDADAVPFEAIKDLLKELNIVNTTLGGHAISLEGVNALTGNAKQLTICEIGCGGGDNLAAIHKKFQKKGIAVNFVGIDINAECIRYAKERYPQLPCEWILSDYVKVEFKDGKKPDIIFSSLFCHHLTDAQLLQMLAWLKRNVVRGFFINDLHRHRLAFYLIKYITKFFSRSYLVRNDACLSVARSFTKIDWQRLLNDADLPNHSIKWKWAFRWLLIVPNLQKA